MTPFWGTTDGTSDTRWIQVPIGYPRGSISGCFGVNSGWFRWIAGSAVVDVSIHGWEGYQYICIYVYVCVDVHGHTGNTMYIQ